MSGNPQNQVKPPRDYCFLIDGNKYNRNAGCEKHDNGYGRKGGGCGKTRKEYDRVFFEHLRSNKDPMAIPVYVTIRLCGWFFFNYHTGKPWRGQLVKKIFKNYLRNK